MANKSHAQIAADAREPYAKLVKELTKALKEILKIGEGGVIERRETGKPTWTALHAVSEIANEAIAKAEGRAP